MTSPQSPIQDPHEKPSSFPALVWDWLACFRTIQLAIILIFLLLIGTLIGVFMPQEGLVDPATIKKTYGDSYQILKAFGLFNVYSSYWFMAIEVLFFFNLLFGSFKWLKPAFFAATRKIFMQPEHILAAENRFEVNSQVSPEQTEAVVESLLRKKRYGVHQGNAHQLYASKGNFSRLGPCVAHLGILLLLVSSLYGSFTGFKAQKLAVPGDTFTIAQSNVFNPNVPLSIWKGTVPPWKVVVKDFRIHYYPNHPETPQQYYTHLQILEPNGKLRAEKTISVNNPLGVEDVTFYQATYALSGRLLFQINNQPKMVSINTQFQNRSISITPLNGKLALVAFPFFIQQDPGVTQNYVILFLKDNKGFVGAAPGKMPDNLRLVEGQSGTINGFNIRYIRPEIATGLQIKKAPEVPWIYLSYLIIITGTVMCFFSQRQIWVAFRDNPDGSGYQALFLYKTNKGRLSFLKELEGLQPLLLKNLSTPASVEAV